MKPLFEKAAIIGVGLIGGSLGMAMCSRGLAVRVTGFDVDSTSLELAKELEAIHECAPDIEAAISKADLVVICTPVGFIPDIIRRIVPFAHPGCIVTDVGSTKGSIVRQAELLMPRGTSFIGGHPMTGSEIAGVGGSDKYLFENAVYVLTPTEKTETWALEKLSRLVDALGAKKIELNPDKHDLMVAAVSHLPHLVATTLVNTVGEIEKDHQGLLMLAAGGFRDTTRVASGHPLMWKDICVTNRDNILAVLDRFSAVLERTRALIEDCRADGLEDGFMRARELRRNIPSRLRGYLPPSHEIVVTVPDKPGVIAELAGTLGSEQININDIEIMRVREGEGGTIRLAFGSEEEQARAVDMLNKRGITVKKR